MAVAPEALFRHGKLLVAGMKLRCVTGTLINCGELAVVKASQVAPLRVEQATLVPQFKDTCPVVVAALKAIENEQMTTVSPAKYGPMFPMVAVLPVATD